MEFRSVVETTDTLHIQAQGTVVAARQVVLQPEITGRVVWQSEHLLPGGRFKRGEPLLRIDPSDYQLSLRQQAAAIRSAEAELKLEESRQQVAAREWEIIDEDSAATPEGRAVALREPQQDAVRASLERARAAHEQATLALGRSMLQAPFNGFIKSESVDVGQLVGPATQLGTLVGTDEFWVQLSVPVEKLAWLKVPGMNADDGQGSVAKVIQQLGKDSIQRQGRVLRLLGDLDPVGRMARLLVAISDPLDWRSGTPSAEKAVRSDAVASTPRPSAGGKAVGDQASEPGEWEASRLPLLLGAYVDVSLESDSPQSVVEVPRRALQEGDLVYVYGAEGKLEIREVAVLWRRAETVLVSHGLNAGDKVIVSRVPGAVAGMPLRLAPALAASAGEAK